ncbi:MAG: phospho-sugar mutase, partial [Coriobacteriia bacterium]|nr:phospho-sugar mutase [Coriobacteriia bacterium]
PSPNPEHREALELGIRLCEEVHPDLLLATDPDTDRVGVAVKDGDDYQLITGNEMGVLLLDYLCRTRTEQGTMPKDPVAVTTIVSTSLADQVAAHYGVEMRRCLTGFKYIGGIIAELEAGGHPERFVFGFEESYGYLAGTHARDKDAVVTSMLICQMARYYRTQGKTLYAAMQDLYATYGFHCNSTLSFTFEGISGAKKMADLMDAFRTKAPAEIAGLAVESVLDYEAGVNGLPSANVIEFDLAGGNKAIVRPSGTEPKIKVYVFSVGPTADAADELNQRIGDVMTSRMS